MHSKNEIEKNNNIFFVFKTFFILSLFFNNLIVQLRFDDNNLLKNKNCYYYGNISDLKIPRMYICNSINSLDYNFYSYNNNILNNIDLLIINSQQSKIYNLLFLIGIMPFLNKDSIIYLKINSRENYKLFKNKIKFITIGNKLAFINKNSYDDFANNFRDIITYKWEIFPDKRFIYNIRYILNNYYNDPFVDIFDDALINNYKNFINTNNTFSFLNSDDVNKLMSKFLYILFYRKFMGI